MPFDRCIAAALADGLIDSERAHEYSESYRQHEAALRQQMTPHEAAASAARLTFAELEQQAAERRRQTFLTLAARAAILQRLDSFKSYWRSGHIDPYLGATGFYDRLLPNRNGPAVEQEKEFWRGQAHAEMDKAFIAYRRDILGRQRTPANEANIVAEAFGHDTGDVEAKAIAQGWINAREKLRAGFNRFGGHIGNLEDYGFPTIHSARLINAVPVEEWKAFTIPLLDRSRILTRPGSRPLSDGELEAAMNEMYRGIVTQNWDTRNPGGRGAAAIANRRDESRFLHFAGPDAWRAYQERFGEGNVFDTMVHHIDYMARDIAHMQVMGPNPAATLAWLKDELTRRAALAGKRTARARAKAANYRLDAMYAQYTGNSHVPVSDFWAEIEGDVRNVVGSALLGMSTLTAVPTDWNFSRMTRAYNGLPQIRAMGVYVKLLQPGNADDRMLAASLGLTAESYARTLHDSARHLDQVFGHAWSRWLIDRALTFNGLTPHTDAMRWAYGWNAQAALAAFAKKNWGALDKDFRDGLQRYRIGESEWNDIRSTPLFHPPQGGAFLRPGDVMGRADLDQTRALDLGQRIADWIMTETEFAVPSSSLAARGFMRGTVRPGTFLSAMASSLGMFKTFMATYMLSHGRRMIAQNSPWKKLAYGGSLVAMSTIAGALALQLREIAQGRNPRDMTNWRFWPQAMIVGGGAGLIGDFLNSAANPDNRSIQEYVGGPIIGFVSDAFRLALGAPLSAAEAKTPQKGQSALVNNTLQFVKRYMPGGNTWYLAAALQRAVFDALQESVDPNWKARVRRVERWYLRQYNQSFWWKRGQTLPQQSPDLHAAAGGSK